MQKILGELSQQMIHIEQNELAPPGWKTLWDRYGISFDSIFVPLSTSPTAATTSTTTTHETLPIIIRSQSDEQFDFPAHVQKHKKLYFREYMIHNVMMIIWKTKIATP